METADVEALALRCIRGEAAVWEFAEALADLRGEQLATVMFGECADIRTARLFLKQAHHTAVSENAAKRRRMGMDF